MPDVDGVVGILVGRSPRQTGRYLGAAAAISVAVPALVVAAVRLLDAAGFGPSVEYRWVLYGAGAAVLALATAHAGRNNGLVGTLAIGVVGIAGVPVAAFYSASTPLAPLAPAATDGLFLGAAGYLLGSLARRIRRILAGVGDLLRRRASDSS